MSSTRRLPRERTTLRMHGSAPPLQYRMETAMKALIHNLFLFACAACIPAAIFSMLGWRRLRNVIYLVAVSLMLASTAVRIAYNWPLMCLYQEPYLISLLLLLLPIHLYVKGDISSAIASGTAAVLVSFFSLLFPGDIYVSFVKTNSIFAHLFSLFSSFARAAYFCSAAISIRILLSRANSGAGPSTADLGRTTNLIIAGFALHTLGMFCGGIWAYCGWGTPIQWESHLLLGMAGVWFYYAWFLHLHLAGNYSRRTMLCASFAGGVLTFLFAFLPDTGVFNFQGIIQ